MATVITTVGPTIQAGKTDRPTNTHDPSSFFSITHAAGRIDIMLTKITQESGIPLFGYDFIGIVDRGTNLIEIKPTTLCNLRCEYCYANVGSYDRDFEVELDYLLSGIKQVIKYKNIYDIEAHVDPYGECMVYPRIFDLFHSLSREERIERVSLQTNGTLLDNEKIDKLAASGVDQLNITLNGFDDAMLKHLSGRQDYNKQTVIDAFDRVLEAGMDLVITPVWFFNYNDNDIIQIIKFFKKMNENIEDGSYGTRLRLGIQNYLVYKTGRRLSKVHQHQFGYFYKRLRQLESRFGIKLLLGPLDFNIHPAPELLPPPVLRDIETTREKTEGLAVEVMVMTPGRTGSEYLGAIDGWGIKIVNFSSRTVESVVRIPLENIKVKRGGLITAWLE
ncbi:radical SAM protein [Candidatus Bathyarchaeota archaeon]|nr:radical SAM protein [Candidatus Bathyarchaeota archaeon]